MRKLFFLAGVLLNSLFFSIVNIHAQCPNLNFSLANFNYWQAYTGSCDSGVNIYPSSATSGRHTIMDAANLLLTDQMQDEQCIAIAKVPTGFNYSARLGNTAIGAEMEALEYTMTIDSTNSLLILHFAWVMEDPNHEPSMQPKFTMTIKDSSGKTMTNISCGNMEFVAGQELQDLVCKTTSFLARNWTTVGFSLEPFMGQKIKIYFETRDCAQGDHYGYAYLVGECRPMTIDLIYCDGQTTAHLQGPDGFIWYKWTRSGQSSWVTQGQGRQFQNIVVPDPIDGEEFICEVTSELGANCSAKLRAVIAKTSIDANFLYGIKENGEVDLSGHNYENWYDTCSRTATFVDLSTVKNSKKESILWEIHGLNVVSQDSMFTYTFPDPETNDPVEYLVRLTVYTENGCLDTSTRSIEQRITIYPSLRIRIEGKDQMCAGDSTWLSAVAVRSKFVSHEWEWQDSNKVTHTATGDSLLIYVLGTYYLTSIDSAGRFARDTIVVTTLRPNMNITITNVKCYGDATGSFTHGPITGGIQPYPSFQWTLLDTNGNPYVDPNGNTTGKTYMNLIAGKYTFEAIDSKGCALLGEVIITQNDSLKIKGTQYKATCGYDNGRLKLTATGGIPPYTFEISKEDGTVISSSDTVLSISLDTASELSVGVYVIKVTDYEGCITSDTISVEAIVNPLLWNISIQSNDSLMGTANVTQLSTCSNGTIIIKAIANVGYHFVQWNDGNTDNPRTISITQDTVFTAMFALSVSTYRLTVHVNNLVMGTTIGEGDYVKDSMATIEAIPDTGFRFVQWNDGIIDNPRTITVTQDTTFTAIFGEEGMFNVLVNVNNSIMGSVSGGGDYALNSNVIISAAPNQGYRFIEWNDNNMQNPRAIVVTQDTIFTAVFDIITYYVSLNINDAERGSVTGGGNYAANSVIIITATPDTGYRFVGWSDGNKDSLRSITVTQNISLTAIFGKADMYYVYAAPNNPTMGSVIGSNDYDKKSNSGSTIFQAEYAANSVASITAIPNTGYRFVEWNDGNGDNPRNIAVTGDSIFTATFEIVNAIGDIKTSTLKIYPNPAMENIHIILPENVQQAVFTLYDMQGKALIRQKVSNQDRVSVSGFAAGIYVYKVVTAKESYTGKMIIKD